MGSYVLRNRTIKQFQGANQIQGGGANAPPPLKETLDGSSTCTINNETE